MGQICSKYHIVQKCCSKGAAKVYVHLTHYQIEAETNSGCLADDVFKTIFLNENAWIKISPKFVPKGPIIKTAALVQMAPIRRQAITWTNGDYFTDAYMSHSPSLSYFRACRFACWWFHCFLLPANISGDKGFYLALFVFTRRKASAPLPSDIIWIHKTWSTLVQVMAWCLMAPSHFLNQYVD